MGLEEMLGVFFQIINKNHLLRLRMLEGGYIMNILKLIKERSSYARNNTRKPR